MAEIKQKAIFIWILLALLSIGGIAFIFSASFRIFMVGVALLIIALVMGLREGRMSDNQRTLALVFGFIGVMFILLSIFGIVPNIEFGGIEFVSQMNIPQQIFTFG